jgi:hypothetical protein
MIDGVAIQRRARRAVPLRMRGIREHDRESAPLQIVKWVVDSTILPEIVSNPDRVLF